MTKNKKRSRKSKATATFSTKTHTDGMIAVNAKKVNSVLGRFPEPEYDLHIEFNLRNDQDMNDPSDWLYKNDPDLEKFEMGSGYSFMSGMRDFSWRGSKNDMEKILRRFANSNFRIDHIYIYPCDWKENDRGYKWCLTTRRGWNSEKDTKKAKK